MERSASSPLRVLARPLLAPASSSSSSSSHALPSASNVSSSSPPNNANDGRVIVIGVIGRDADEATQLINRILDTNAFGSGNQDKEIRCGLGDSGKDREESISDWFRGRRISYFFDEEKGIVFLLFVTSPRIYECDSASEERDSDDLRGVLTMFLVCHVIVFLHEGSRFHTNLLKKFRLLQSAKHALSPFVKSQVTPLAISKSSSLSSSLLSPSAQSKRGSISSDKSPNRGRATGSRNLSSISLMSGSYSSLFPGQCTPVILFVFVDDFTDEESSGLHTEDQMDELSTGNPPGLLRGNVVSNSSNSVVVLSRPANRNEGGYKKKLQSSLDAQIRFLIKKCRTLSGGTVEGGHSGSSARRMGALGSGAAMAGALFSLDASRAVAFLDRSANHKGESLNFVIDLIEEVLNGKASLDVLHIENNSQNSNKEDAQLIREFIYRQCDILRGRGGLATNPSSGSAAGVGMAAVAAAAAASAASGGSSAVAGGSTKLVCNPPELPSLENWMSATQLLLDALVSRKHKKKESFGVDPDQAQGDLNRSTQANRKGLYSSGTDAIQAAISFLESSKGLNMKFSGEWCQNALPSAMQVYMEGLPPCYPTKVHEEHLQEALCAFSSMVKGSAVQIFFGKLKKECDFIWKSGRQLCDAISLTGHQCMHQKHDVEDKGFSLSGNSTIGELDANATSDVSIKKHCSGYVFLHACACGRSRCIRDDPFDFENANVTFNHFPECENVFFSFALANFEDGGPVKPSAWRLIRLGASRYYEPSKGLLQSGFCKKLKFLSMCIIVPSKHSHANGVAVENARKGSKVDPADQYVCEITTDPPLPVIVQKKGVSRSSSGDNRISFGTGLPALEMKKSFTEAVTGKLDSDSAFPPLQQRKRLVAGADKSNKQSSEKIQGGNQGNGGNNQNLKQNELSVQENPQSDNNISHIEESPFLQIGSNVVPVILNGSKTIQPTTPSKSATVYVGFEHECSYGHRFLLSTEHLEGLGAPYSSCDNAQNSSMWNLNNQPAQITKQGKLHRQDKVHPHTIGAEKFGVNPSKEGVSDHEHQKEQSQLFMVHSMLSGTWRGSGDGLQHTFLNDDSQGYSLLNTNLPIYMNCPHCRVAKPKKGSNVKFASTISQLQRIFLVTPPFPTVLATCPIVQFEGSLLPESIHDRESQSHFSLSSQIILPPESFMVLRLPFIYGVQLCDGGHYPLQPLKHKPESTAWIMKDTVLQVLSKGNHL